ncbi:MAG: hypothetical protein NVSMB48_10750 [Marmoricola sp.]
MVSAVATPTSFDGLRMWEGSQHRAFEELSYQLLKSAVPEGAQPVRTGNPDGGVEWYATVADGTEWGWQAKHVAGIDSLLTAMTDSVKRVAKERPSLRRLTFAISWNLSTGTRGRARKSQRQKYEDKVDTWKRTIAGADVIEFELVQGSDLLDQLAKPEHRGRVWFWWGGLILGQEWLTERYNEQSDAAGDKYRPDLQVDIPIQEDLLALGFDPSVSATFDGLRRRILSAVDDLHIDAKGRSKLANSYRAVRSAAMELRAAAAAVDVDAGSPPEVLQPLADRMSAWLRAVETAADEERRLEDKWRELPKAEQKAKPSPTADTRRYDVRHLMTAIDELRDWLDSSPGRAWVRRHYFLTVKQAQARHTYSSTRWPRHSKPTALRSSWPAPGWGKATYGQASLINSDSRLLDQTFCCLPWTQQERPPHWRGADLSSSSMHSTRRPRPTSGARICPRFAQPSADTPTSP